MARRTKREKLLEKCNSQQPDLIDGDGLPTCASVLESVVRRRYEHTGARLLEDDAKALRLVELLVGGWGVKRISREMSISPKTVRAARRALVAQGKMAPYVQRVTDAMEDAIEAGVAAYRDALEEGKIPAVQIPVGVAIMFDKRALARGEPTSISAAKPVLGDELSEAAINAAFEKLPVCNSEVVLGHEDCRSVGNVQKRQQIADEHDVDAALDATLTRPEPPSLTPADRATLTPTDRPTPDHPPAAVTSPSEGAGGEPTPEAVGQPDPMGSEN